MYLTCIFATIQPGTILKRNPIITYLIHIPVLLLLAFWLYRKSAGMPLRNVFWVGLILKSVAGIALGLVYTYYYTYQADTFLYFKDACTLSQLAWEKPAAYVQIFVFNAVEPEISGASFDLWQQPRAFFMAKLISLFTLFTGNNYWINALYVSLLSFYGFWRLANTLAIIFPSSRVAAAVGFLLFPSVVFWSSGLIKESITMACITGSLHLLLAYHSGINRKASVLKKPWHSVFILFSCYLVWKLKYYYLAVFVPVYLSYIATLYLYRKFFTTTKPVFQTSVFLLIFSCILVGATALHPSLHTDVLLGTIIENHDVTLAASAPEDVIYFRHLQPTFISLSTNLPLALASGLFRPFIWEGETIFQWFTGIENACILLLSFFALWPSRLLTISQKPQLYLLLVAVIVYVLLLAALLAFSAPNFGTLARYKAGFLPFLVYLIVWSASIKLQERKIIKELKI